MKFERIMDKKILRAPRVKKIGHREKTGNEKENKKKRGI